MAAEVSIEIMGLSSPPCTPPPPPGDPGNKPATVTDHGDENDKLNNAESVVDPLLSPPGAVKVRYTVSCSYDDGQDFSVSQNEKPLEIQVKSVGQTEKPVIEVITMARVTDSDKESSKEKSDNDKKPQTLGDKRILAVGRESLVIHSAVLSEMVRSLVDYYPGQNLTGDTITIHQPFGVLAHHDEQLQALLVEYEKDENHTANGGSIELQHLRILMDFVQKNVRPKYTAALPRLLHKTPTVTFDDVWYAMRPGQLAYGKHDEWWIGCQIESTELLEPDYEEDLPQRWEVRAWFIDYAWDALSIYPVRGTFTINKFDGESTLTGLSIYPRKYFDKGDESKASKRRTLFEERGALIRDILWKGYRYLHHDGMRGEKTHTKMKGPIVVGRGFNDRDFVSPDSDWTFPMIGTDQDCPPEPSETSPIELRSVYSLDVNKHSSKYLKRDHLFLMCPILIAFFLDSKTWGLIHIENTSELEQSELPAQAILDSAKQTIVEALSTHHTQDTKPWSADYIKNKGDGVVILLHGPPGVGKTYTVETTALRTHRPLISLTIAEIGTKEDRIESELTKWFSLAEQWRAILLIDECDIFLERRNFTDIARNGVVAAFLRKVEYFGGLLFLTTNRIGEIDEAFMSRVHAVFEFESLNRTSRQKIWDNLLLKLSNERGGSVNITPSVETYLGSDEILNLDWNGREIRNAFQTAVVLAEHESKQSRFYKEGSPISLEDRQFKQIRAMNQDFRKYLTGVKGENREKRANAYYGRNDAMHRGNPVKDGAPREPWGRED